MKLCDKVESSKFSFDEGLHDPCYEMLRREIMPSQQPGGPSTQNPGSMPQQQQQNSPNMSVGSSHSSGYNFMFGLSSQSPPDWFASPAGGSQLGGPPQQQQQQSGVRPSDSAIRLQFVLQLSGTVNFDSPVVSLVR